MTQKQRNDNSATFVQLKFALKHVSSLSCLKFQTNSGGMPTENCSNEIHRMIEFRLNFELIKLLLRSSNPTKNVDVDVEFIQRDQCLSNVFDRFV